MDIRMHVCPLCGIKHPATEGKQFYSAKRCPSCVREASRGSAQKRRDLNPTAGYWRPVPCAGCGVPVSSNSKLSLPAGERRCLDCRRQGIGGSYVGNIPNKKTTSTCEDCGSSFTYDRKTRYRPACDECQALRRTETKRKFAASKGPLYYIDKSLISMYSITLSDYNEMLTAQGGGCALCGKTEAENGKRLAVDHDHSCCPGKKSCGQCVRGILCTACNTTIGRMDDSPAQLRRAADYLERPRLVAVAS